MAGITESVALEYPDLIHGVWGRSYIRTSLESGIIDTGLYGTQNTKVDTKFKQNADYSDSITRIILGDYWWTGQFLLSITPRTNASQGMGNRYITRYNYWTSGAIFEVYMDGEIGQRVNDVVTVWSGEKNNFTTDKTLTILGVTDDANRNALIDLWYLKIWSGSTLQRYYLPARNKSGEVGLYDIVEGKFIPGTFTFGLN